MPYWAWSVYFLDGFILCLTLTSKHRNLLLNSCQSPEGQKLPLIKKKLYLLINNCKVSEKLASSKTRDIYFKLYYRPLLQNVEGSKHMHIWPRPVVFVILCCFIDRKLGWWKLKAWFWKSCCGSKYLVCTVNMQFIGTCNFWPNNTRLWLPVHGITRTQ